MRRIGRVDLARAWRENMLSLLDSAQVELSEVEYQLLARWLLGMPAGGAGS